MITRTIVIPASGNLLIHGEGTASTIEAAPEYSGYAAADALQGESEVRVKDPGLFRVNDHIAIIDDTLYGEGQTSTAVITDIRGDLVMLDTPLGKSYLVKCNARLVRTFHLMATEGCAHNRITPNVTIRDLQFTGGLKKNHQGLGLWQVNGGIISGNTVSGIGTYDTDKGPVDFISLKGFGQDEYLIKTQVAGISFLKWFQEDGGRPGENSIISGNNIYEIGLSGIFVFAAQAIHVSGNLISNCPTGIDCSESRYCLFTGNTLRGCGTGIHFYSKDEAFPTSQNVFTNNLLVNCEIPELSGDGARLNSSGNNHVVE